MEKSIDPVSTHNMPTALYRGINLGNALDAPNEGDWGWVIEEEHFDAIKEAGFDHVRIPIRWSTHAAANTPYTIDASFFDRIDWVIAQALQRGLTVVINMHHYNELFQDPGAHKARFLSLWQQIAARYQAHPDALYFEILNEPNTALTPELWNPYAQAAHALIRQTNPHRYIVIDTAFWGNYGGLHSLVIPEGDPRIIVSFHFYVPWEFCFQGANWMPTPPPVGQTWRGTSAQQKLIINALNQAVRWSQQHHNVPLWNGEYCVHHWADFESRVLWTRFVTHAAEQRGIANTIWNFHSSDSAGLYNPQTGTWVADILHAVIPDTAYRNPT